MTFFFFGCLVNSSFLYGREHFVLCCTEGVPNQTKQSNGQIQSSRGKLIDMEVNDYPKFQVPLKNLHSAKSHQTKAKTQRKEVTKRNSMK